ncbi:MAG: TonB-dependent receptor [Akkermansiaceae bacterium]
MNNQQHTPEHIRPSSKRSHTAFAGSLAGAMLLGGNLQAQTTQPETVENLADTVAVGQAQNELNPTQLSSPRFTAPLKEIPKTITVVNKDLMKQQNATTIQAALRNVPGISLQAGEGGTPAGDQLSIRGFSSINDFYVDGVRDIGGYTRDPFNIEQIEVAKGPGSTDSGRGSTGGSINLSSKKATLDKFTDLSLGVGTNAFYRTTLDYNQPLPLENSAFRLNLMRNSSDLAGREDVDSSRWGIAPTISFGLGTDTEITLSYMHMSMEGQPDYGIPWLNGSAPDVDFSNYYGLADRDYEETDTDILTAELKHTIREDFKVRALARYGRTHRDSITTAPRFVSGSETEIRRTDFKSRLQTNTIKTLLFDSNLSLETGAIQHDIVAGMEYNSEKSVRTSRTDNNLDNAPNTDLFNPTPGDSYTTDIVETGSTVGTLDTFSLFFYDTIKLGEKWTLNGGARYDHMDAKYVSTDTYTQTNDTVSWKGSIAYAPTSNGNIYLAYGTSVNPSAETLSLSDNTAALDPEESTSFELGTKWTLLENRLSLNAAIFRTNKDNARSREGRGSDYELAGDFVSQGFELGATGEITEDISIFAGYTYLDTETKKSLDPTAVGDVLGNSPKHSFSIWATYQATDFFTLGGGVRYIGERTNGGTNTADGYATVDVSATYQVNDDMSVQLNILNLANEEYVDQVGGGHFIPGEGRSAALTVNYSF